MSNSLRDYRYAEIRERVRDRIMAVPVNGWDAPWITPHEAMALIQAAEDARKPRPPAPGVVTGDMVESAAHAMFYARQERPVTRWQDVTEDIHERFRKWARAALVDAFTERPAEEDQ